MYVKLVIYQASYAHCFGGTVSPVFKGLPFILATALFCILKILAVMCKNCLDFNVQGSKAALTWALAIHFNQLQKMIMCGSILLFLLAS